MSAGCHYSKLFGLERGVKKADRCIKCGKKAAILLPYGPQKFCEEHFLQLIESRYRKTVRKFQLFEPKEHLVVAVSGGKDSLTALCLANKFYSNSNKITAILIDEGIPGYRDKALKAAKENCRDWGVPFKEFSFKKAFGFSMKEIQRILEKNPSQNLGSPCTFCGTLRRSLLNKAARRIKADKLITGHNLDDEAQGILMNACDNDLRRFARGGAKSPAAGKGLVQRVKPLCEIPEREVFFYTQFRGIRSYSGECCPFSGEAKRNDYRSVLNQLEEKFPGTKHSLWRFYNEVQPALEKKPKGVGLKKCKKCGEPCSGAECEACRKIGLIRKLAR